MENLFLSQQKPIDASGERITLEVRFHSLVEIRRPLRCFYNLVFNLVLKLFLDLLSDSFFSCMVSVIYTFFGF